MEWTKQNNVEVFIKTKTIKPSDPHEYKYFFSDKDLALSECKRLCKIRHKENRADYSLCAVSTITLNDEGRYEYTNHFGAVLENGTFKEA